MDFHSVFSLQCLGNYILCVHILIPNVRQVNDMNIRSISGNTTCRDDDKLTTRLCIPFLLCGRLRCLLHACVYIHVPYKQANCIICMLSVLPHIQINIMFSSYTCDHTHHFWCLYILYSLSLSPSFTHFLSLLSHKLIQLWQVVSQNFQPASHGWDLGLLKIL